MTKRLDMVEESVIIREVNRHVDRNEPRHGRRGESSELMWFMQAQRLVTFPFNPEPQAIYAAAVSFTHPASSEHDVGDKRLNKKRSNRRSVFLRHRKAYQSRHRAVVVKA